MLGLGKNMSPQKKKSLSIAIGLAVITTGVSGYWVYSQISQPLAASIDSSVTIQSRSAHEHQLNQDITKPYEIPGDSPLVSMHVGQESKRFNESVNQLGTFITGENQFTNFVENTTEEQPKQTTAEKVIQDSDAKLEAAFKRAEEKGAQQEETQESEEVALLLQQIDNQNKMMREMENRMQQMDDQMKTQAMHSNLDLSNSEAINQVLASILKESTVIPSASITDYKEKSYNPESYQSNEQFNRGEISSGNQLDYLGDYPTENEEIISTDEDFNIAESKVCLTKYACHSINPGDMEFGLLQNRLNSDNMLYATVKLSSGPLSGAQLFGVPKINSRAEKVVIMFNSLSYEGETYQINAVSIDPATKEPGTADDVNNHYFSRYGSLIAGTVLSKYADTMVEVETEKSGVTNIENKTETIVGDESDRWIYAIGKSLEPASAEVAKNFNRPPTITVESIETGNIYQGQIGIMFIDKTIVPIK